MIFNSQLLQTDRTIREHTLFLSSLFSSPFFIGCVISTLSWHVWVYTQRSTFLVVAALHLNILSTCPSPPFAVVSLVTTWWSTACSLLFFSKRDHGNSAPWVLACLKNVWSFYTWGTAWQHIKSLAYTFSLKYPMSIVPLFWHWKLLGLAWFYPLMNVVLGAGAYLLTGYFLYL